MRFQELCIACSKRQGERIFHLGLENQSRNPSVEERESLIHELHSRIDNADPSLSPAELSLLAIRIGEKHASATDPFHELKRKNNQLALALLPELKQRITTSSNPLHLACQLAACGNIIDLGIHDDFNIHATIEKVIREGFRRDDFSAFDQDCQQFHQSKERPSILYICDNAGEIVFDRLFIEEILRIYPRFQITAVVRGIPVLNDAILEDAQETGLTEIVQVIDNGNSELGTVWEKTGTQFQEFYRHADLIVSKGQANYETLQGRPENIYFILKAKCEVIAASLEVQLWDAVMVKNGLN